MGTGTSSVGRNGRGGGGKSAPAIRPNPRDRNRVSYRDVSPDTIRSIVEVVANSGGAVMFGQTSDGGAFSFMLLYGNEKVKEYPRDQEEWQDLLKWLSEEYLA